MSVMSRLNEHYRETLEYFDYDQVIGVFCQGSQNYGLELPTSDLDSKAILVPSFADIAQNRKPISTTHIRENEEHIDFKDIRLYMETFRKQNLNFLEILFTDYKMIHPDYEEQWNRLIAKREEIARMNEVRAVKSMKGIAMEKYHAMEHRYPSKIDVLDKYGYDPKQLHHLARVEEYLKHYVRGEAYGSCLRPNGWFKEYLLDIKRGAYNLVEARKMADALKTSVESIEKEFCAKHGEEQEDPTMRQLLIDVQTEIMRIAIKKEFEKDDLSPDERQRQRTRGMYVPMRNA